MDVAALEGAEVPIGKWQHFKGKNYEVLGVSKHSETLEEYVVYRGLYYSPEHGNQPLWIRPKAMFLETVDRDGKVFPRFRYIGP